MIRLREFGMLLRITRSHGILRRYFVVNGFDGALTMMGINMGFYAGADVPLKIVIGACLGAAVALGMSGLTSAYISEAAERKKWLSDLEDAMVGDLSESAHSAAARIVPLLVALVNGAAPLFIALIIIAPLGLAAIGTPLPLQPLELSLLLSLFSLFLLGAFLGKVSGSFWLWSGLQTLLAAGVTALIIFWVSPA
jgi:predicted membrane protein (TIGR00267 family)